MKKDKSHKKRYHDPFQYFLDTFGIDAFCLIIPFPVHNIRTSKEETLSEKALQPTRADRKPLKNVRRGDILYDKHLTSKAIFTFFSISDVVRLNVNVIIY